VSGTRSRMPASSRCSVLGGLAFSSGRLAGTPSSACFSAYVAGLTIAFNDGERRRRRRRARAQLIDAQAGAFIETSAGRTDSQTKGVSVSTQEQGGAQGQDSPMEPDSPQEPTPGEPGTMPEEPRTAPDAPTMPEEPDLAPPESPEESGDS
jgi:hypothetical protein